MHAEYPHHRNLLSAQESANATSTISTAQRDVPHHVQEPASFEHTSTARTQMLARTEHRPADQSSVSFDHMPKYYRQQAVTPPPDAMMLNDSNVDSSRALLGRIQSIREDLSHMS